MASERARRIHRVAAMLGLLASTTVLVDACVIADPPTDLPTIPQMRPTIIRTSVVPPPSAVLGRWPEKFIVPVEMSDPLADLAWATFVDYNPYTGDGLVNNEINKRAPSAKGGIRTLEIPITMPSSDRCHVVEIVVALRLNTSTPQTTHTPEPPGGDVVSWFYNPSGDLVGCPILDAGIERVVLDAEAGAEAGGQEQ